ncbi:MAG: adenine phosphoribosyltransferase [Betaproteobacteria bacterium]
MDIAALIRTIPDHPSPGILFRDITTLLKDAGGFAWTIEALVERYRGQSLTKIAGVESRGFMFGAPLAVALGAGFVPIRKTGKLPASTIGLDYALEYGTDRLEMHTDALQPSERILLVDDLLATGGTARAAAQLLSQAGGEVIEAAFVIELPDLGGRTRLAEAGVTTFSLVSFGGH